MRFERANLNCTSEKVNSVLTHLRRMVLKINFRRLVKKKYPEEEIKAYPFECFQGLALAGWVGERN